MRLRIFKSTSKNGKEYWNIPATNYKNPQDKLIYFVGFTKDATEPMPQTAQSKNGNTYQYADIDVLDAKFSCYNGSPQISIFKWVAAKNESLGNRMAKSQWEEPKVENQVEFEPADLPFY